MKWVAAHEAEDTTPLYGTDEFLTLLFCLSQDSEQAEHNSWALGQNQWAYRRLEPVARMQKNESMAHCFCIKAIFVTLHVGLKLAHYKDIVTP
jgi:hypothetical protein